MMSTDASAVDTLYSKIKEDAEAGGYHLNPDVEFTKALIAGLLKNEERYGYQACPCRLTRGEMALDLDIICPCDYRDPDLSEYGACYCALYVSSEIANGEKEAVSIPERRPVNPVEPHEEESQARLLAPHLAALSVSPRPEGRCSASSQDMEQINIKGLPFPVWRCKVCGYLCARPQPPEVCPICKVKKERFERFI